MLRKLPGQGQMNRVAVPQEFGDFNAIEAIHGSDSLAVGGHLHLEDPRVVLIPVT
jgi:hypothetical protein